MVEIEALDYSDCMYPSNRWFFLEVGYYYLESVFPQQVPPELLPAQPILIIPHPRPETKRSWKKQVERQFGIAGKTADNIRIVVDPPIKYQSQIFFKKGYQYEYILIIDSTRLTRIKRDIGKVLLVYYEWLDLNNLKQILPCISLNMILWDLFGHEFLHFALKHIETPKYSRQIVEQHEAEVDKAFYQYLLPPKDQALIQVYEFLKYFYDERLGWFD